MKKTLDWEKYLETASRTVSEGIVMLKNNNSALPLKENDTVSVFGRIQLHYYKSGTGSGGMVNVSKVTGITDGLIDAGVKLNEELLGIYRKWDDAHPYDLGSGWGGEPWSQKEMILDDDVVSAAAKASTAAIVIIGRTAGEEMDARLEEGSFLLTGEEKDMLRKVRGAFNRMIVLLNVGGLIDLEFIEEVGPDALLYVWQGGMTGGTGTADVLTGKISPCGKLPDTIAYSVDDYPSAPYFGDKDRNFYTEDIYVGYRWFETFAPEKVRYPFGFGLSYTTFSVAAQSFNGNEKDAELTVKVTNTGDFSGKEVVQLYCEAPQGRSGKPLRVLCGFEKTGELAPGASEMLTIRADMSDVASYDDSGVTGNRFCWVLEAGEYRFYAGTDVRSAELCGSFELKDTVVVSRCRQALAPVERFDRVRPELSGGKYVPVMEAAPLSEVDEPARRFETIPEEIPYTGDKGIRFADVYNGRNTLEQFVAQLTDDELCCTIRGEGMGSPRVTAGTASAFGGVTDRLNELGVPAACCSDGPSGMRLDCGTKAFSLPNGTMIASTFNKTLAQELFALLGLEMTSNNVECLLGPGMNIHRHPLNGRNFEYFSEDPYLTGAMAAAELRGLHSSGVTGTIKHFCGNNQETNRHFLDTAASERALREIYLRGFGIAVRDGAADSIMTTYGKINGVWTAGDYDLNTEILRKEWGFTGFVMTDWWANINRRGGKPDRGDFAAMAMAQNDVYMVCSDGAVHDDNTKASLETGELRRSELQRNAMNVFRFLLGSNAVKRIMGTADTVEIINRPAEEISSGEPVVFYDLGSELHIDLCGVKSEKGQNYSFALTVAKNGWYDVTITASSEQGELAQMPLTVFAMGTPSGTYTWNGTGGKPVAITKEIPFFSHFTAVRLYFAQNGLDLISIDFKLVREAEDISIAFGEEN